MPPSDTDADRFAVIVTVVRSGGFAGLRREWTAAPGPGEASAWVALIQQCPWDDVPAGSGGGNDRFVWAIDARPDGDTEHSARLGDHDVRGPWRALVDAVRDADGPDQQPQNDLARRRVRRRPPP